MFAGLIQIEYYYHMELSNRMRIPSSLMVLVYFHWNYLTWNLIEFVKLISTPRVQKSIYLLHLYFFWQLKRSIYETFLYINSDKLTPGLLCIKLTVEHSTTCDSRTYLTCYSQHMMYPVSDCAPVAKAVLGSVVLSSVAFIIPLNQYRYWFLAQVTSFKHHSQVSKFSCYSFYNIVYSSAGWF